MTRRKGHSARGLDHRMNIAQVAAGLTWFLLATAFWLLMSGPIQAQQTMTALALMGLVLFGFQVWINKSQTLRSDFFPASSADSVAGLGGTGAGIGAMIFTLLTGWVVKNFSYVPILVAAGSLAPRNASSVCTDRTN